MRRGPPSSSDNLVFVKSPASKLGVSLSRYGTPQSRQGGGWLVQTLRVPLGSDQDPHYGKDQRDNGKAQFIACRVATT